MSATRDARHDAREYARAQMFYGEGAGTRRKLIQATVDARAHQDPTYARTFHTELARQNMAEHAKKAQAERSRRDRAASLSRNVKGVLNGSPKSLSTGILIVTTVGYVLHQTGYDAVLFEKTKQAYLNLKSRRRNKSDKVHNIARIHT